MGVREPAAAAVLRSELAVTRRLLAAAARATTLLALQLEPRVALDAVDGLRRDSRIEAEAADAIIAHLKLSLAAESPTPPGDD